MKIRLHHHTKYVFSTSVFLEPHILKFKPRQDPGQQLISFELKILPGPVGRYEYLDESNNISELVWFNDLHEHLIIEAESELKLLDINAFSFLIYPFHHNQIPIQYHSTNGLDKYLLLADNQINTHDYIKQLMSDYRGNTMDFLLKITEILHADFEKTVRHSGSPHDPDYTLEHKQGSCRDLAVLEMEMLRKAGFASRFVSGYKFNDEQEEDHELHAWVEVYIPGPGWMGFDPSTGLMVGNDHIPVSSSYLSENTLPVSGTFRGKAEVTMSTKIQIDKIE